MLSVPGFSIAAVYGGVPARQTDNYLITSALAGEARAKAVVEATGFPVRRSVAAGVGVLELALPAAHLALEGMDKKEIGGVVAVSFSHRRRFPALAAELHRELGLPHDAAALDLGLACSGYPYGLMVAGQLAAAGGKPILLVDGDVQSALVDAADINTLAVMSDAATATLVVPGGEGARFAFYTDGTRGKALECEMAGPIRMNGFEVFRFVATEVTAFLKSFIAQLQNEVEFFVPHQANMYMIRQLATALSLNDRLLASGPKFANPGSSSIPLTLAAGGFPGEENGKKTFNVLLAGFGAGLAASAALLPIAGAMRRGVVEV